MGPGFANSEDVDLVLLTFSNEVTTDYTNLPHLNTPLFKYLVVRKIFSPDIVIIVKQSVLRSHDSLTHSHRFQFLHLGEVRHIYDYFFAQKNPMGRARFEPRTLRFRVPCLKLDHRPYDDYMTMT